MKINAGHGSPWTTTGGNALKFYTSMRVQLSTSARSRPAGEGRQPRQGERDQEQGRGTLHRGRVRRDEGEGIDRGGEVIDLCVDHGILKAKGAWLYYGEKTLAQGRPAARHCSVISRS